MANAWQEDAWEEDAVAADSLPMLSWLQFFSIGPTLFGKSMSIVSSKCDRVAH